jgi:hypothetical protein
MRKSLALLALLLSVLAFGSVRLIPGQHKGSKQTARENKGGDLSAYVFLITRSGDLKPARLAQVYLFRSDLAKAYEVTVEKQMKLLHDTIPPAAMTCKLEVRAYDKAIESAIKAALEQEATDAYYVLQTDEEGKLQSKNIEPGGYRMLVRGRAGFNDAYWSEFLTIDAGKITQIKLAEPKLACPDVGD